MSAPSGTCGECFLFKNFMRPPVVIFASSALIVALLGVYAGSSIYFCAGALKGDFGGCAAMASADILRSTTAQIAAVVSAVGLVYALRRRRR